MVNELLVTASVDRVRIDVLREGDRYSRTQYGITYPYIFPERQGDRRQDSHHQHRQFRHHRRQPVSVEIGRADLRLFRQFHEGPRRHTIRFGASYEYAGQNDFDQINV